VYLQNSQWPKTGHINLDRSIHPLVRFEVAVVFDDVIEDGLHAENSAMLDW